MASIATHSDAPPRRTVLVTGANGYIGLAVCRAFVQAGWRTLGLVRRAEAAAQLALAEVTPVVGTFTSPQARDAVFQQTQTLDVIVSCTEEIPGYAAHYAQVVAFVRALAETSRRHHRDGCTRPLVLWTSGCKDYGTTPLHGDPALVPHTEDSPLAAPGPLRERADSCLGVFAEPSFDAVLLRPTSVFGYSSSYYGLIFQYVEAQLAQLAQAGVVGGPAGRKLRIPGDPASVMHALHVDDCAEAYRQLAELGLHETSRSAVAGHAFNVSGRRYETLAEVAAAVAREYGFTGGVDFVSADDDTGPDFPDGLQYVFSFSQWVGSDRVRAVTGWADKRALFSEDIHTYRQAYDAARATVDENIDRVRARLKGV